jgi:hypothetical protein
MKDISKSPGVPRKLPRDFPGKQLTDRTPPKSKEEDFEISRGSSPSGFEGGGVSMTRHSKPKADRQSAMQVFERFSNDTFDRKKTGPEWELIEFSRKDELPQCLLNPSRNESKIKSDLKVPFSKFINNDNSQPLFLSQNLDKQGHLEATQTEQRFFRSNFLESFKNSSQSEVAQHSKHTKEEYEETKDDRNSEGREFGSSGQPSLKLTHTSLLPVRPKFCGILQEAGPSQKYSIDAKESGQFVKGAYSPLKILTPESSENSKKDFNLDTENDPQNKIGVLNKKKSTSKNPSQQKTDGHSHTRRSNVKGVKGGLSRTEKEHSVRIEQSHMRIYNKNVHLHLGTSSKFGKDIQKISPDPNLRMSKTSNAKTIGRLGDQDLQGDWMFQKKLGSTSIGKSSINDQRPSNFKKRAIPSQYGIIDQNSKLPLKSEEAKVPFAFRNNEPLSLKIRPADKFSLLGKNVGRDVTPACEETEKIRIEDVGIFYQYKIQVKTATSVFKNQFEDQFEDKFEDHSLGVVPDKKHEDALLNFLQSSLAPINEVTEMNSCDCDTKIDMKNFYSHPSGQNRSERSHSHKRLSETSKDSCINKNGVLNSLSDPSVKFKMNARNDLCQQNTLVANTPNRRSSHQIGVIKVGNIRNSSKSQFQTTNTIKEDFDALNNDASSNSFSSYEGDALNHLEDDNSLHKMPDRRDNDYRFALINPRDLSSSSSVDQSSPVNEKIPSMVIPEEQIENLYSKHSVSQKEGLSKIQNVSKYSSFANEGQGVNSEYAIAKKKFPEMKTSTRPSPAKSSNSRISDSNSNKLIKNKSKSIRLEGSASKKSDHPSLGIALAGRDTRGNELSLRSKPSKGRRRHGLNISRSNSGALENVGTFNLRRFQDAYQIRLSSHSYELQTYSYENKPKPRNKSWRDRSHNSFKFQSQDKNSRMNSGAQVFDKILKNDHKPMYQSFLEHQRNLHKRNFSQKYMTSSSRSKTLNIKARNLSNTIHHLTQVQSQLPKRSKPRIAPKVHESDDGLPSRIISLFSKIESQYREKEKSRRRANKMRRSTSKGRGSANRQTFGKGWTPESIQRNFDIRNIFRQKASPQLRSSHIENNEELYRTGPLPQKFSLMLPIADKRKNRLQMNEIHRHNGSNQMSPNKKLDHNKAKNQKLNLSEKGHFQHTKAPISISDRHIEVSVNSPKVYSNRHIEAFIQINDGTFGYSEAQLSSNGLRKISKSQEPVPQTGLPTARIDPNQLEKDLSNSLAGKEASKQAIIAHKIPERPIPKYSKSPVTEDSRRNQFKGPSSHNTHISRQLAKKIIPRLDSDKIPIKTKPSKNVYTKKNVSSRPDAPAIKKQKKLSFTPEKVEKPLLRATNEHDSDTFLKSDIIDRRVYDCRKLLTFFEDFHRNIELSFAQQLGHALSELAALRAIEWCNEADQRFLILDVGQFHSRLVLLFKLYSDTIQKLDFAQFLQAIQAK